MYLVDGYWPLFRRGLRRGMLEGTELERAELDTRMEGSTSSVEEAPSDGEAPSDEGRTPSDDGREEESKAGVGKNTEL